MLGHGPNYHSPTLTTQVLSRPSTTGMHPEGNSYLHPQPPPFAWRVDNKYHPTTCAPFAGAQYIIHDKDVTVASFLAVKRS